MQESDFPEGTFRQAKMAAVLMKLPEAEPQVPIRVSVMHGGRMLSVYFDAQTREILRIEDPLPSAEPKFTTAIEAQFPALGEIPPEILKEIDELDAEELEPRWCALCGDRVTDVVHDCPIDYTNDQRRYELAGRAMAALIIQENVEPERIAKVAVDQAEQIIAELEQRGPMRKKRKLEPPK